MRYESQTDLKHYGVPGMHWGKRKAAAGAWVKEAGKATKNTIAHPILTKRADRSSKDSDTMKNFMRRSFGGQNTKDLRDINQRVSKMVADKAARKESKNSNDRLTSAKSYAEAWLKEAGKLTVDSYKHPILSDRANKQSIKADPSLKSRLRRKLVYQNTNDLRDINQRVSKMVADKKAK